MKRRFKVETPAANSMRICMNSQHENDYEYIPEETSCRFRPTQYAHYKGPTRGLAR